MKENIPIPVYWIDFLRLSKYISTYNIHNVPNKLNNSFYGTGNFKFWLKGLAKFSWDDMPI